MSLTLGGQICIRLARLTTLRDWVCITTKCGLLGVESGRGTLLALLRAYLKPETYDLYGDCSLSIRAYK